MGNYRVCKKQWLVSGSLLLTCSNQEIVRHKDLHVISVIWIKSTGVFRVSELLLVSFQTGCSPRSLCWADWLQLHVFCIPLPMARMVWFNGLCPLSLQNRTVRPRNQKLKCFNLHKMSVGTKETRRNPRRPWCVWRLISTRTTWACPGRSTR